MLSRLDLQTPHWISLLNFCRASALSCKQQLTSSSVTQDLSISLQMSLKPVNKIMQDIQEGHVGSDRLQ